jgi:hypothetical protein
MEVLIPQKGSDFHPGQSFPLVRGARYPLLQAPLVIDRQGLIACGISSGPLLFVGLWHNFNRCRLRLTRACLSPPVGVKADHTAMLI